MTNSTFHEGGVALTNATKSCIALTTWKKRKPIKEKGRMGVRSQIISLNKERLEVRLFKFLAKLAIIHSNLVKLDRLFNAVHFLVEPEEGMSMSNIPDQS